MRIMVIFFFLLFPALSQAAVVPGIEQLFSQPYLKMIEGKRVGVLAHFASRDHDGKHLVDLLHARTDLDVALIFSPEHGFRGAADEEVPDSRDPVTGLAVYSLYGPRRIPSHAIMDKVDVVVVDLQDVGVRFYTYPATVAWLLMACAREHKPVILLDRPNPLGLEQVEGALLQKNFKRGITTFYPIAMRHGMTLGELELFYNHELKLGADLTVVPVLGLNRSMLWDQTGVTWIQSSPALPTLEQAYLYGVFGVLETLNLAVGRGVSNEAAFLKYGAPWISAAQSGRLLERLNALNLDGLSFAAAQWKATRSIFKGEVCRGFSVHVTDAAQVQGFLSLVEVLKTLYQLFGESIVLSGADGALGSSWVRQAITAGVPTSEILKRAHDEADGFFQARAKFLLYK